MKPLVVFKTLSFPTFSETFIVSNIKEAIDAGYMVKIIVDLINPKDNSSQPDILAKYGLLDKTFKFEQPQGKITRKIKAIYLLLNPLMLYYFIKYCKFKGNKTLDSLFILNFYWEFRKAKAIHVHFATAIYPLFELKEIGFLKSKIIVTFHGYDEHGLKEGESLKKLINKFNKYVAHITANTNYLKNKLVVKGFPENTIKIIHIGTSTAFFNNETKTEIVNTPFRIITVGRLVEIKGQVLGIKAIKILKDRGYDIEYALVGDGEEIEKLKTLVKELKLQDSVCFYGLKNQNEIKKLLKQNDLFLMTSTCDDFGRREAFGVVSLEAQAMGLPVIGFKSGGFPETIIEGETGITVKDTDFFAMANEIELLINNPDKVISMGDAAKKHIRENFDSRIVTTKYLELYL